MDIEEKRRLTALTIFEKESLREGYETIAGVDEAGRGPLAGPVVAAACILPPDYLIAGVDDSKKLTPNQRASLFKVLIQDPKIIYGIGIISSDIIDQINILQATIKAMQEAVSKLRKKPEILLIDGLRFRYPNIPTKKIIKGDSKSLSIASASIIAKETRDQIMIKYCKKWPEYGFSQHKGYGTKKHLEAIKKYGPCPIHRYSYAPITRISQRYCC